MKYTINSENKAEKTCRFVITPEEGTKKNHAALVINGAEADNKGHGVTDKKGQIIPRLDIIKKEHEMGVVKTINEHTNGIMPYYGGKFNQSRTLMNEILQLQLECKKLKFISLFHGGMSTELGVSKYRACLGFDELHANDGDRGTHLAAYCIKNERERFVEAVKRRMDSKEQEETMSARYTRVLREAARYIQEHKRDNMCSTDKAEYAAAAFLCTSLSRDNMTTGRAVFKENNKMCLDRLDAIMKKLDNGFERECELLKPFMLYNDVLANDGIDKLVEKAEGNELFFLDPPYTKGFEGYAMALDQRNFMHNISDMVEKGCSIIICGYDNALYEEELVQKMGLEKKLLCKLQNSHGNINDEYIWVYQGREVKNTDNINNTDNKADIRKAG